MSAGFEINVEIVRTGESPEELKNGPLVALLKRVKQQITAANQAVKQAEVDRQVIETLLMERMQEEEVDSIRGSEGSAYIKETELAQIDDFEALGAFCSEENTWYLFQRRINNAAFRELLEDRGEEIPGLSTYVKRVVATR